MKFAELNLSKQILKSLESMGLSSPTTIQEKAFSVIMSGRDVVGIAQTGTGKTLAFLLPILNLLKYTKNIEPRVIILVPTRELVLQIVTEIEKLTTNLNIRSTGVYGGANINTQKDILLEGTDILVGTPGRTYDLALSGYLKLKNEKKYRKKKKIVTKSFVINMKRPLNVPVSSSWSHFRMTFVVNLILRCNMMTC
jgi:ATP-dependent RNA helicase RhlE